MVFHVFFQWTNKVHTDHLPRLFHLWRYAILPHHLIHNLLLQVVLQGKLHLNRVKGRRHSLYGVILLASVTAFDLMDTFII